MSESRIWILKKRILKINSTLSGAVFDMMSFWWCCLTTNFQVQQDSHSRANRLSYFSMSQLMLAAVLASIQSPYHKKCSERKEKVLRHLHNLTIQWQINYKVIYIKICSWFGQIASTFDTSSQFTNLLLYLNHKIT